jgi:hypothetical protein
VPSYLIKALTKSVAAGARARVAFRPTQKFMRILCMNFYGLVWIWMGNPVLADTSDIFETDDQ